MRKYTAKSEKMPALLAELWGLLVQARQAFGQERVFQRAVALLFGELFALGRHTVTQLLRALGATDQDWSAWYRLFSRQRFAEALLGWQLLVETLRHVSSVEPYLTTVDAVRISRSGPQVGGSSWWQGQNTAPFNPGLVRGQRFVEVTWLTPEENSYRRAVPLRWWPAPTEKAVPCAAAPRKEWEAGLAAWAWVRQELDGQGCNEQWLVGLGDGTYDTQGIWRELPEHTVLVIRCARNRALYALPPKSHGRRGAPAKYGERLPAPWTWLRHRKQLTPLTVRIRGRERRLAYRVVGPVLVEGAPERPLFLIVVGGRSKQLTGRHPRRVYRLPVYYLVNAVRAKDGSWRLPYPAEQLLAWAWQRWECEVAHREMKSSLGIGEKQCWSSRSALSSVQWGVWVYSLCVLAAYRTWGVTGGPRRAGHWYGQAHRWSFAAMWQSYRAALWAETEFRPLYARTLNKWLKKETWLTGLHNSLADPARI